MQTTTVLHYTGLIQSRLSQMIVDVTFIFLNNFDVHHQRNVETKQTLKTNTSHSTDTRRKRIRCWKIVLLAVWIEVIQFVERWLRVGRKRWVFV